nr:OPT/YSL family transporter [Chloroflexota bacterium]
LPIGIPVLLGRPDLLAPMLIGATMGMLIDLLMLYWLFDSRVFPGRNAWPPGVAAAEAIIAGDQGGKRALFLVYGTVVGLIGSWLTIPMSAFGVAFIGNMFALSMFGVGLLIRGYSVDLTGININALYMPHGVMIGAGLVAMIQVILILLRRHGAEAGAGENQAPAPVVGTAAGSVAGSPAVLAVAPGGFTRSDAGMRQGLVWGFGLYVAAALILALIAGLMNEMPLLALLGWIIFAAVACVVAEFIVGMSAMHAGWFPAFATALIFLVLGMIIGFPAPALAMLVGFVASGGPAFADAGYDLKAGWVLRGQGRDPAFERYGRLQQVIAGLIGLAVGWVIVALFHNVYFSQDLFPPVDRVYVAAIQAGVDASVLQNILLWAIPGALIQAVGGSNRQMGILLATGLLIMNPLAGWAVLVGLVIRVLILRFYNKGADGEGAETPMTIFAAGIIAGDAIYGFFSSVFRARWRL